jgi:hypothetical protein
MTLCKVARMKKGEPSSFFNRGLCGTRLGASLNKRLVRQSCGNFAQQHRECQERRERRLELGSQAAPS